MHPDKQAIRMAIHAMTDDEVKHEAEQMDEKARLFQGIAAKLKREYKKRQRQRRDHVTT